MSKPGPPANRLPDLGEAANGLIDVATWVSAAAKRLGIDVRPQPVDIFANAAARLADTAVQLDRTELLILGLDRAGIIPGRDAVRVHAAYLRQKTR